MSRKGHRRKLSEEERILWHRVGRTVEPLRDRPLGSRTGEDPEKEFLEAMQANQPRKQQGPVKPVGSSPFTHVRPVPKPQPAAAPAIDRPTTRKLAKGRVAIDARIDLHAMTQDQAHDRLYTFLADQRSRGARHVLVVTGKGRSLGSEGVLKRMVPIWLNSPRYAGLVSGYSSASRHHGGDGAIYIRLRKLARPDGSIR